MFETCHCDFDMRLVKCMRKFSSVKFPVEMAGIILNNFFSHVVEYQHKHKKMYNEGEELAAHVVYASVDKISRISKGALQRRKNRSKEFGKVWWRNVNQNWVEEQFKEKFRICKCKFGHRVSIIRSFI